MANRKAGAAGLMLGGALMWVAGPAALAAPTTVAGAPETKPAIIPIAVFAERDLFTHPSMSPDGTRVAVYVAEGGKSGIKVLGSSTRKSIATAILREDMEYGWHR